MNIAKRAAVIGGGPAGLMAAEILLEGGVQVDLYESMPSVGRKFLLAGKGGLNITHSEPFDLFLSHYGARRDLLAPMLNKFGPVALQAWVHDLGINTFVGSSGRIFPSEMKAAPLLRAWLHRLREAGLRVHVRHRWCGWQQTTPNLATLCFDTPNGRVTETTNAVVLALGGGSWAKLGSDGAWVAPFVQCGVQVAQLKPSNCGFVVEWSPYFRSRFAGQPLKSIALSFTDHDDKMQRRTGELMLTDVGVEGSLVYAVSATLRDAIATHGFATIVLDLAPDKTLERLIHEIAHPRGARSLSSHLQSRAGIKGVKMGLMREILPAPDFNDARRIATAIKSLPITLTATRPLDEAISSAGGVVFDELDANLMLHKLPGFFCAGEMLDWEAPTGGYLLTGCFASGCVAGLGALRWLNNHYSHVTTD